MLGRHHEVTSRLGDFAGNASRYDSLMSIQRLFLVRKRHRQLDRFPISN